MEVGLVGPKYQTQICCNFYSRVWSEKQHWCCNQKGYLNLCYSPAFIFLCVCFALCMTFGLKSQFSENFTIVLFHYDGRASEWDNFEWSKKAIHISARKQTKWLVMNVTIYIEFLFQFINCNKFDFDIKTWNLVEGGMLNAFYILTLWLPMITSSFGMRILVWIISMQRSKY